jgi:hypothetical protein
MGRGGFRGYACCSRGAGASISDYGKGADSQSLLYALMTEKGSRGNQPLHLLANMARQPAMRCGRHGSAAGRGGR